MRHATALLALAVAGAAGAADQVPEVRRPPVPAQAIGVEHTVRVIPEACARLQGRFTGDPANPYAFSAVRTSTRCQPRARLVDAGKASASAATGWILNDVIRVPSAACTTRQAVVRVWRHPVDVALPELDAQGRARIYLDRSLKQARAGDLAPIPSYAVAMTLEGLPCKGG